MARSGERPTVDTPPRDHHATIFLPGELADRIDAVRRQWDPGMVARIAPHATLVYPHEAPIAALLVERLRDAASATPPFRLRLGELRHSANHDAVWIQLEDVDGGYAALRERILPPPFRAQGFPPHVTLVHPRTSSRGPELWAASRDWRNDAEFTAREVMVTAFDGARWIVVARCALAGAGSRPRVERWRELAGEAVAPLVAESEGAGLRLVRRLVDDWASGANRFDRPGEAFFVAVQDGRVIGVCGLNVDPYAGIARVGRVRHLYVLTAHRRRGVGRSLVQAVVEAAGDRFDELRLRTQDPAAARLYECLGFVACTDAAASTHRRLLVHPSG
jgi:GNAT superfamily N-acetyltransferase/2'-5' RNA ligase